MTLFVTYLSSPAPSPLVASFLAIGQPGTLLACSDRPVELPQSTQIHTYLLSEDRYLQWLLQSRWGGPAAAYRTACLAHAFSERHNLLPGVESIVWVDERRVFARLVPIKAVDLLFGVRWHYRRDPARQRYEPGAACFFLRGPAQTVADDILGLNLKGRGGLFLERAWLAYRGDEGRGTQEYDAKLWTSLVEACAFDAVDVVKKFPARAGKASTQDLVNDTLLGQYLTTERLASCA